MKKIQLFTIPNFITLGSLACGCVALVCVLGYGDLETAFWLTVAAAVLDFLDGFTARLLKAYSEVGKQLDSLSDMVSFGVVPSAFLYDMYCSAGGDPRWAAAVFVLALFSALRLAKFNVDDSQSDSFVGVPTPACALLVASCGWMSARGNLPIDPIWILITAVCLSVLLVAPVRMMALKFRNFSFRDNSARYIFIIMALAALAAAGIKAVPFVILFYIVLSLALAVFCRKGGKSAV